MTLQSSALVASDSLCLPIAVVVVVGCCGSLEVQTYSHSGCCSCVVSLVQGQENVVVKEPHFGTVAAEIHLLMGSVKVQAVMIVVVGMKWK